jgi:glucose/arabinose dehydrogenase
VSADGVVYVNTWSGRYYANKPPHAGGFLVALADTKHTGKADVVQRFGETVATGGAGGTGIGLYKTWLYAEINDKIVRYELPAGAVVPTGPSQTIVSGLPLTGDHPMHPFAIDSAGALYVDVATATNACQIKNRTLKSPGAQPCDELKTRGGIWRFDANKTDQVFSSSQRYATGIRNGEGFGVDTAGQRIFVTQHGRDQLHANWPDLYKPDEEATLPAEEVLLLTQGGDYGWPECYFDAGQNKLVQAPEYGGDGGKAVGPCASKLAPVAAYPAHWAPNGMVFYDKTSFPAHYQKGLFIAFHGSWDRAPYGQQGYNVVFQALSGDKAAAKCEIFADGFAGAMKSPGAARAPAQRFGRGSRRCAVRRRRRARAHLSHRVHRGSGGAAAGVSPPVRMRQPVPDRSAPIAKSRPRARIPMPAPPCRCRPARPRPRLPWAIAFSMATSAAHPAPAVMGPTVRAHPLGPNLADQEWLWSDGSVDGIAATITQGVAQPKQYRAPMPAMGGATLTPDQVKALAAYVWGLSHRPAK